MSIDLMSRIPDREDLDSYEKLVLLIMCDRADEDGLLWYANETIARKCSMTKRGVQKVMDRLVGMGLVRKMHRHDRSNFYIINVDMLPRAERQPRPAKEMGPVEYLEEEPDLFAGGRGERGSSRRGERGSARGERGSIRGEPGSPDSLTDPDMIPESSDARLCRLVSEGWAVLLQQYPDMAPFPPLTDERKRGIVRRTDEHLGKSTNDDARAGLWAHVFRQIGGSKLLTGAATDWPGASLDWLLKKANFGKVVGKQYGNGRDAIGTAGRGDRSAVEAGHEALGLVRGYRGRTGERDAHPAG